MPFKELLSHEKKVFSKWSEIEKAGNALDIKREKTEWIFRGQDCDKPPTPALERTISDLMLSKEDAFVFEFALIDRFARNLHIVDPAIPRDLNLVELLSTMRHYGAPTRLLDFTYSFYVAVFFAIENLSGKSPVIWAIDAPWLVNKASKKLGVSEKDFMPGKYEKDFKKYFLHEGESSFKSFVYQITPDRLNQRLSIQQGTFLCQSDIRLSFEANFAAVIGGEKQKTINSHVKLFRISPEARKEVMKKLTMMNISRASLFPGLDGFAQSLATALLYHSTVKIYRKKREALLEREGS